MVILKKNQCILFERTRLKIITRKKERNNNGDRTKTVLQIRDEEMEKEFFSKTRKVNEGDFSRKELMEQKKQERERE